MSSNDEHVEGELETGKKRDVIQKAIGIFEARLAKGDMKITAGEYIRLLELLQEIDGDKPREMRIRWVAQNETESSTEE